MSRGRKLAVLPQPEADLFERIRGLVLASRKAVARGIDLVQVHTCFEIGRHVVEHEQQGQRRADYGKALLDGVSARLTAEFGRGFSRSNIALMRSFFLAYAERSPIVQTASGQSGTGQGGGAFAVPPARIVQTPSG